MLNLGIQGLLIGIAQLAVREGAFENLWALVQGAIALHSETFQSLQNQPHSLWAALTIVFIAGFAQSLSQIVVDRKSTRLNSSH